MPAPRSQSRTVPSSEPVAGIGTGTVSGSTISMLATDRFRLSHRELDWQPQSPDESLAALVPARVLSARKRGFSIPAAAWLRGELQPFAREVLSQDTGYLDRTVALRYLEEHAAGKEDWSRQLWGLLAFTLWHERQRQPSNSLLRGLWARRYEPGTRACACLGDPE